MQRHIPGVRDIQNNKLFKSSLRERHFPVKRIFEVFKLTTET